MSFRVKPEVIFIIERNQPSQEEDNSIFPPLDMYYAQGTLYIEAEIPGVEAQEVKITLKERQLVIEGNKKEKDITTAPLSFLRMERFMGPFKRTVQLPQAVDSQGVKATFRKGVLYIQIPIKREEFTVEIQQED